MAEAREGGPPSLSMVAAGGVGVLVVLAFVSAVALGSRATAAGPGERVGVGRADAAGALAVFVPRCDADRIRIVEVAVEGGDAVWRIASRKGSIDERYVVGAEAPLGFATEVPLAGPVPEGVALTATVSIRGEDGEVRDRIAFAAGDVPDEGVRTGGGTTDLGTFEGRALASGTCPERRDDLGLTSVAFGAGALLVVGSYGLMVSRWWRGRASPDA